MDITPYDGGGKEPQTILFDILSDEHVMAFVEFLYLSRRYRELCSFASTNKRLWRLTEGHRAAARTRSKIDNLEFKTDPQGYPWACQVQWIAIATLPESFRPQLACDLIDKVALAEGSI